MKSLNKINPDYLVVGVSALIILTFSVLLYADFTRKLSAGSAKQIGTITFKRKNAQRKYNKQVVWEDIEQNSPVYNNDSIRTEDISEAVIKLNDGTAINLDENSMILLAMSGEGININFDHGAISAHREGGGKSAPKKIEIKTRDTTVSFGKGGVSLSKDKKKKLNVTVTKGAAEVNTRQGKQTVKKDQKIVISKDKTRIVTLNLKLKAPSANDFIVSLYQKKPVTFSWEKVKPGSLLTLEVAKKRDFAAGTIRMPVRGGSATLNLASGVYYWRLSALRKGTAGKEYSSIRKLNILQDTPVSLIYPPNKKIISYTIKPPVLNFKWRKNSLASRYRVEVSDTPGFTRIRSTVTTPLTSIALESPGEGTFYWRIRTETGIKVKSYKGTSLAYRFTIRKMATQQPPILISPEQGRSVSADLLKKKGFLFSWKADRQVKGFEIFITVDKNFKNVVLQSAARSNFYSLKRELPPKQYFWRVASLSDGKKRIYSAPRTLKVIPVRKIKLASPRTLRVYPGKKETSQSDIRFSWTGGGAQGKYLFELSKNKGFTSLRTRRVLRGDVLTIRRVKTGAYLWRVSLLDRAGNTVTVSPILPLNLSYKGALVASIKAISPPPLKKVIPPKGEKGSKTDTGKKTAVTREKKTAEKDKIKKGKVPETRPLKRASLLIISSVHGGRIYVNKNLLGTGRAALNPRPGEKVLVEVRAPGFYLYKRVLSLKGGEKKKLYAQLVRYRTKKRVRWSTNLASPIISKPAVYGNVIILTTRKGSIAGLSRNGLRLWRRTLDSASQSSPLVHKGTAYVATVDSYFYALNAATGGVRWKKKINGSLIFGSTPVADRGRVFIATTSGTVYAFSDKGKVIWQKELEAEVYGTPSYSKGVLYIGTDESSIFAIDTEDGDIIWEFETDSRIFLSSPRVYKDIVFAGSDRGTLYALTAKKGKLLWSFNAHATILTPAIFNSGLVFVGNKKGMFYALSISDGKESWKFDTGESITAAPGIFNNRIYLVSGKSIYVMKTSKAAVEWKERFESTIKTPASVIGNDVYIGMENGEVRALRNNRVF